MNFTKTYLLSTKCSASFNQMKFSFVVNNSQGYRIELGSHTVVHIHASIVREDLKSVKVNVCYLQPAYVGEFPTLRYEGCLFAHLEQEQPAWGTPPS